VCVTCIPFEIMAVPNAWILIFNPFVSHVLCTKATRERREEEKEGDCPYVCTPPHRAAEEEERFKLM
jgi:hypothetical protein